MFLIVQDGQTPWPRSLPRWPAAEQCPSGTVGALPALSGQGSCARLRRDLHLPIRNTSGSWRAVAASSPMLSSAKPSVACCTGNSSDRELDEAGLSRHTRLGPADEGGEPWVTGSPPRK